MGDTLSQVTQGLGQILINFQTSFPGIVSLIFGFSYAAGLALAVVALLRMREIGDDSGRGQQSALTGVVFTLFAAAALMFLPTMMASFSKTLFMNSASPLDYANPLVTGGTLKSAIAGFIAMIGMIAFVRGIFVLRAVGNNGEHGNNSVMRAIVLLVAGVLCIHILDFLKILANTFGFAGLGSWLS